MYAQAADFLQRIPPIELTRLATADDRTVVDSDLLRELLEGGVGEEYTVEQVNAAEELIAHLERVINDSSAIVEQAVNASGVRPDSVLLLGSSNIRLLKTLTMDIAVYRVRSSRHQVPEDSVVFQVYKAAMRTVELIATHKRPLIVETKEQATERASSSVEFRTEVFTAELFDRMIK